MELKHKSKLHLGFDKQVRRQRAKPEVVKIKLPISNLLPKNFKGKYKHYFRVYNSQWNGMNLMNLRNRFNVNKVGGMYGIFYINANGKYQLSRYGKERLRKKKLNKLNKLI